MPQGRALYPFGVGKNENERFVEGNRNLRDAVLACGRRQVRRLAGSRVRCVQVRGKGRNSQRKTLRYRLRANEIASKNICCKSMPPNGKCFSHDLSREELTMSNLLNSKASALTAKI